MCAPSNFKWFIIKLLLNIYFYLWTIEHVQYIKKIHLQTKSNWLQSAVTNWCISSISVNICTLCNVKFKIVQVIHDFNCYWHFDERNEFYCEYAYSKTFRNGNTSFAHKCTMYMHIKNFMKPKLYILLTWWLWWRAHCVPRRMY